jgi:outer membrane protein TolC
VSPLAPLAVAVLGAGAVPLPAELAGYLRAAERGNPSLQASRAELAASEARQAQAVSALLPRFFATAGYTRNQFASTIEVPIAPGEPPELIAITEIDQLDATAGVSTRLFSAADFGRIEEARHARDAAAHAAAFSLADLQLRVARAYYDVVAAQGFVTAAEEGLTSAGTALEMVEARLRAGRATALEVETARADEARARRTLIEAGQELATARRDLALLAHAPEPGPLPEPPSPSSAVPPEEELIELALRRREDVKQLRSRLQEATASRVTAWAGLSPEVNGFFQESYTNATGFLGRTTYWTAGATVDWSVDPWLTRARVRLASAGIAAARARLMEVEDRVRRQVHAARLEVSTGEARVREADSERRSLRLALELTQVRAREGVAGAVELGEARVDLFRAEAVWVRARANFAYAALALRQATGELLLQPE